MPKAGDLLDDKYKLLDLLGEGGTSEVFRAENTWTGQRVAIKTLLASYARRERIVKRFMLEARIASRLRHPNIAQVLDLGVDDHLGVPFIVQELLEGESLLDRLARAPSLRLQVGEAIAILKPVMGALVAVHRKNIVHRDLKPANIFLARDHNGAVVPKIIDFGIAKVVAEAEGLSMHTQEGVPIGTPFYMSPEQASGDHTADAQADVWSMGVVLYEALSGTLPYEGANNNVVIAKVLRDPPKMLDGAALGLPAALVDVIARAIERDRSLRYRTMQQFLGALLDCHTEHSHAPQESVDGIAGTLADDPLLDAVLLDSELLVESNTVDRIVAPPPERAIATAQTAATVLPTPPVLTPLSWTEPESFVARPRSTRSLRWPIVAVAALSFAVVAIWRVARPSRGLADTPAQATITPLRAAPPAPVVVPPPLEPLLDVTPPPSTLAPPPQPTRVRPPQRIVLRGVVQSPATLSAPRRLPSAPSVASGGLRNVPSRSTPDPLAPDFTFNPQRTRTP